MAHTRDSLVQLTETFMSAFNDNDLDGVLSAFAEVESTKSSMVASRRARTRYEPPLLLSLRERLAR